MEYIHRIRKLIGTEPILVPTTAVFVLNSEGQILLQLRGDNGLWGIPGGIMDLGETVLESAVREVFEETGLSIDLTDLRLFAIFSGSRHEARYPNGDRLAPVVFGFVAEKFSGSLNSASDMDFDETQDLRFFSLDSLPENLHAYHQPYIETFLASRNASEQRESNVIFA